MPSKNCRIAAEGFSSCCISKPRSPSYEEIGEMMNMPVASIGPTRARCLEKLRTVLPAKGIK